MPVWPANGVTDWNDKMKAVIDVSLDSSTGKILVDAEKASAMTGAEGDRVVADKGYVDAGGPYVKLVDSKANGTVGGTATVDTWTKRTVVEESDTGGDASVSSSVIVLSAGTYRVSISSPFFRTDDCKIRLRNTTSGSTLLVGTSEFSDNVGAVSVRPVIKGLITVDAAQNLEIQYYVDVSTTTSDLGQPTSSGEVEIYTVAEFFKR